ncbi:MAG: phytanoyl-CoA dioxygenase family protein [Bacteroidota bacterium]
MKLTEDQLALYRHNGYVVIENLLDQEEIRLLKSRIPCFKDFRHLPNVICEDNGDIRSVFTPHRHDPVYEKLYLNHRFVQASRDLLEDDIYLYQYKLNLKKPFTGKMWEWHQDFAYWHLDDGVARDDMLSVMIYLDDTRSYQGPLMVIPGSHKFDVVTFQQKEILNGTDRPPQDLKFSLGANLKYTVDQALVKKMADANGIEVLEYGAGSCIFFHANLFHASNGNLSPYERDTIIMTYNSLSNLPQRTDRPDFVCSRTFEAIQVMPELELV